MAGPPSFTPIFEGIIEVIGHWDGIKASEKNSITWSHS